MIELRHARRFDRELAGQQRSDACCRWTRRRARARAGASVLDVARAAGIRIVDLHRLEDGELETDDAGWAELGQALERVQTAAGAW